MLYHFKEDLKDALVHLEWAQAGAFLKVSFTPFSYKHVSASAEVICY